MKKLIQLSAMICLMLAMSYQAQAVQSYREWKSTQVNQAQMKVQILKVQIDARKNQRRDIAQGKDPNLTQKSGGTEAFAGNDAQVERLERMLKQENDNLEMAKDLSVSDYFAGYLTKVKDKKTAFNEVAGKLSAEEVAELMNVYANSVFGSHAGEIPSSATANARDNSK